MQKRLEDLKKIIADCEIEIADIKRANNLKKHKKLWKAIQSKSVFKCKDRYYGTRYIHIVEVKSYHYIKALFISDDSIEIILCDFDEFMSSTENIIKIKEIPEEIINTLNNADITIRL